MYFYRIDIEVDMVGGKGRMEGNLIFWIDWFCYKYYKYIIDDLFI